MCEEWHKELGELQRLWKVAERTQVRSSNFSQHAAMNSSLKTIWTIIIVNIALRPGHAKNKATSDIIT